MAAVIVFAPAAQFKCGLPFRCSVGPANHWLQSLSCSIQQALPCKGIGFGAYGLTLTNEKASTLMDRLGLNRGGPSQARLRYWNDWASPADLAAMVEDPTVAEEWAARRVLQGQPASSQSEQQEHQQKPWRQLPLLQPGSELRQQQQQQTQQQQQQQQQQKQQVLAGAWLVPFSTSPSSGVPVVTKAEVLAMARILMNRHFGQKLLRRFPEKEVLRMVGAVAVVESSLQPFAYRFEEKRGEASTGLMQVLQSTADWLVRDHGYRAYDVDWASSMLYRPFVAIYFGLAYLEWLSDYRGKQRDEEFVIRGYNGGPWGATRSITDRYWSKYQAAKQAFPLPEKQPQGNSRSISDLRAQQQHQPAPQAAAPQGYQGSASRSWRPPAVVGAALQGPALQGPALYGPALQGPALQGPALQGPALQGPVLQGPALQGPALQGPALQGPALQEVTRSPAGTGRVLFDLSLLNGAPHRAVGKPARAQGDAQEASAGAKEKDWDRGSRTQDKQGGPRVLFNLASLGEANALPR